MGQNKVPLPLLLGRARLRAEAPEEGFEEAFHHTVYGFVRLLSALYVYIYVCMYIYVCVCVYMFVCLYVIMHACTYVCVHAG